MVLVKLVNKIVNNKIIVINLLNMVEVLVILNRLGLRVNILVIKVLI